MPALLSTRIKLMRRCAVFQLAAVILLAISFGVLIQVLIEQVATYGIILLSGGAMGLSIVVLLFVYFFLKRRSGVFTPYRIPISVPDKNAAFQMLYATPIDQNAYLFLGSRGSIKVRLLALYQPSFSASSFSKQRKQINANINQQYHIPQQEPYFDAVSRLRINLVVCDNSNDELEKWVSKNPVHLLSRNESIVSAAILIKEQTLLLPAFLSENLYWKEIKKYEAAATLLVERLSLAVTQESSIC